jgi:hypothetical protein
MSERSDDGLPKGWKATTLTRADGAVVWLYADIGWYFSHKGYQELLGPCCWPLSEACLDADERFPMSPRAGSTIADGPERD